MKPKSQSLVRYLALSAVALTSVTSHAADVTLTGSSAINGMNTNYTVNSPDSLILDITGLGGNRASDSMGAAIAKSGGNLTIDGNGTLRITGGSSDVLGVADVSGRSINISLGSGGLINIQGGAFVNGGWGGGNWSANLADMNIASGAVFDVWDGGAIRVDALTGAGSVQNGSNNGGYRSLVVGVDGGSGTFSGVIGGGTGRLGNNAISLTKEGSGTQILSGNNTYAGTTTVTAGTLQIGDGSTTGSLGTGNVSVTGNLTFNRSDNYFTGSGQVFSGAGTITKEGAGDVVFNGAVDHKNVQGISTVVVNDGLVRTDNWGEWNSNLNLTVNGSGKFEMWNTTTSIGNLSGNGTVQNTKYWGRGQTLTIATGSFSGTITDSGITTGGPGTGDTRINLVKSGSGTLTLSGTNSYTGATTVSSGTLKVSGSIASSDVTVNGGILASGSSGTVGKNVTVNSGASFAAGDVATVGAASVANDLNFSSGSIFDWDLTTSSNTYDTVSVAGTLTITSGAKFNVVSSTAFTDTFWDATHTWSDIFGGKTIDNFLVTNFLYSGSATAPAAEGYFTVSGSSLTWTAVPEPTSALAGLLITAGLLRRRRA